MRRRTDREGRDGLLGPTIGRTGGEEDPLAPVEPSRGREADDLRLPHGVPDRFAGGRWGRGSRPRPGHPRVGPDRFPSNCPEGRCAQGRRSTDRAERLPDACATVGRYPISGCSVRWVAQRTGTRAAEPNEGSRHQGARHSAIEGGRAHRPDLRGAAPAARATGGAAGAVGRSPANEAARTVVIGHQANPGPGYRAGSPGGRLRSRAAAVGESTLGAGRLRVRVVRDPQPSASHDALMRWTGRLAMPIS